MWTPWVAWAALALTLETQVHLTGQLTPRPYWALVMGATLLLYGLSRLSTHSKQRLWVVLGMLCLALGVALAQAITLEVLLPLALLCLVYFSPLGWHRYPWLNLRRIPGLKTLLIAVVWVLATTLPPWAIEQQAYPWPLALERFWFILALSLPFDVRDAPEDARNGISTLVHLWGEAQIWRAVYLALSLGALCSVLWGSVAQICTALLCSLLVGLGIALRPKPLNNKFLHGFLDGSMILHGFLGIVFVLLGALCPGFGSS